MPPGKTYFPDASSNCRGILPGKVFADGGDLAVRDSNVGHVRVGCRNHGTVVDDRVKAHSMPPRCG